MAQKTLNAFVVIGGRVDNSFGQIGTQLINLGSTVDEISRKLIDFGKKSAGVYESYETNLLLAEGALATKYGEDSTTLKNIMRDLDAAAKSWANSSIFHTNDVGNALLQAARAGWNYEEIMSGIPSAMKLAEAGGLDLSQGLAYIITSTQAAGVELKDLDKWVDTWAFAANSSAGSINEFGEAIEKMGATSKFAESPEELMTLLAVLHNNGTKGAAAGTLLRNTMLRLIAPTKKARDVMQELNISEGDLSEALGEANGDLDAAATSLENAGFSAYDESGNLKGFVQIFTELDAALKGMKDDEERNNVLASIFPTRTVTGAMAFLDGATEGFDGLYDTLKAGEAQGYSQYLSELMMSGQMGSTELLKSKIENLQLLVGEKLAPDIQKIQGWIGGIIDDITNMDDDKFNALVSGLKVIAVAGPGLTVAGSALRFIGMLLTPAGIVGMGAVTLAAIAAALGEIRETDFSNQFGDMHLDKGALGEYVKTLGEDFDTAFANVKSFADALDTAAENYKTASSTFSSDLLTAVLTNKEFTPEEKAALEQKGIDIYSEVLKAINASGSMAAEFWGALYGGEGVADYDPRYQEIVDLIGDGQQGLVDQANGVAEKMKAAMIKGFEEGFTKEDYETILKYFEEYNALIATAQNAAANEEMFVQQQKWLHKAQTASLEDIQEMAETVTAQRDADLADMEDRYLTERARLVYYAKQTGMTDAEAEAYVASKGVDEEYDAMRNQYAANYDEFLATLWETQIQQSDLGDEYASLGKYADLYMSGTLSADAALDAIYSLMGGSSYSGTGDGEGTERAFLGRAMGYMITSLGGEKAVAEKIGYYESAGNAQMAERMRSLLAMEQLVNGFTTITTTEKTWINDLFGTSGFATTGNVADSFDAYMRTQAYESNQAMMEGLRDGDYTPEEMRDTIALLAGENGLAGYFHAMGEFLAGGNISGVSWYRLNKGSEAEYDRIYKALSATYDLERVYADMAARDTSGNMWAADEYRNQFAIYGLLFGAAGENAAQYMTTAMEETAAEMEVTFPGAVEEAEKTHAAIENAFPPIRQLVYYDPFLGGAGAGTPRNGYISMMADGGRATRPVIFGEAGPEWFIPEAKTERTAQLLLRAASASGFTLTELAEYAGGRFFADGGTTGAGGSLNWSALPAPASGGGSGDSGGGGGSGITVQYSPVIHADNAAGVESVLLADKKRLEKWMEEWWARRQLYESMVTYQ